MPGCEAARLHEFGKVIDVGKTPLAVRRRHEPLRDAQFAHQGAPHDGKAALMPERAVARKTFDPAHCVRRVRGIVGDSGCVGDLFQTPQRRGVQTKPIGRERGAQAAQVARRIDGCENPLDLLCVERREHRGLREFHTADAPCRQHAFDQTALLVRLHEHRNVAGREGRVADRDGAFARTAQEAHDLGRARFTRFALGLAFGQCALALRQRPDAEIASIGVRVRQRRPAPFAGSHRLIVEAVEHERLWVCLEDPIASFDDRRRRALVDGKRVARRSRRARRQIGMQIRRAKTVDGLLWIADQKERTCRRKNAAEDCELQRIGVLELVDQRGGITCSQRIGEPRMRCERAVEIGQQIVERNDAARALARHQFGGRIVEPCLHQRKPARALRRFGRNNGCRQRFCMLEERMLGRFELDLGGFLQRGSRQFERSPRRRRMAIALREVLGPGGDRGAHMIGLVRGLAQPVLRLFEQRHDRIALRMPQFACSVEAGSRIGVRLGVYHAPTQLRQRLFEAPRELFVERRRAGSLCHQPGRERRMRMRDGLDLLAPEIGRQFEAQSGVVGFHFERERHCGSERSFLQRPLAKRVDRVNRRLIECAQRSTHHLQRRFTVNATLRRERRFEEAANERIAAVVVHFNRAVQLGEAPANALVQFAVAAFVKVTTRIWSAFRFFSSSNLT